MKKVIITILIAGAVVGGYYFWQQQRHSMGNVREPGPRPMEEQQPQEIRYQGQDGKNAFELLTAVAEVEFKSYDFGVFVESINGVKPDEKHFWKLLINGQDAQVGADQLMTKNGDVVEWRMEEIK